MTTALKLDVPLKVDLAVGVNWLDVENVRTEENADAEEKFSLSSVE
jgi:hypothetical protein